MKRINTYIKLKDGQVLYAGNVEKGSDGVDIYNYHFYSLYDEMDSDTYISKIGVALTGTADAIWKNNQDGKDINEVLVMTMNLVLPELKIPITKEELIEKYPQFPVIVVNSSDEGISLDKSRNMLRIGGSKGPREFIKSHILGGKVNEETIKEVILKFAQIQRITNINRDGKFWSERLPEAIFMDSGLTLRAYVELERDGYITAEKKNLNGFSTYSYLTDKGRNYFKNTGDKVLPKLSDDKKPLPEGDYVRKSIVEKLSNVKHAKFDLQKLIELIKELNENYKRNNPYASAALLRSIIDHVPPIFGHQTFSQVANNHAWEKTDKNHMFKLADYRDVADDALHRQIRSMETLISIDHLPNGRALDALLTEILIILEKAK